MNLSNQTRTLLIENMDGELCDETVWLARDILFAITDKRGRAKKAIDDGVVGILKQAIWDYETKQLEREKVLTGFTFEGGV